MYFFVYLVFVSRVGSALMPFAVPLILYEFSGSLSTSFIGYGISMAPSILVAIFGSLFERSNSKVLFVLLELLQLILCFSILILDLNAHIYVFIALVIVYNICGTLSDTVIDFKVLPEIKKSSISSIYGLHFGLLNISYVIAPLISYYLYEHVGLKALVAINGLSFIFSFLAILFVPKLESYLTLERPLPWAGAKELLVNKTLFFLTLFLLTFNLAVGALIPTLLLSEAQMLQFGGSFIWISVASFLSAVVSFTISFTTFNPSPIKLMKIPSLISLAATILLVANPSFTLPLVVVLVTSCAAAINIGSAVVRYSVIPAHVRIQTNAIIRLFVSAGSPLSLIILGGAIELFGLRPSFLLVPLFMSFSFMMLLLSLNQSSVLQSQRQ